MQRLYTLRIIILLLFITILAGAVAEKKHGVALPACNSGCIVPVEVTCSRPAPQTEQSLPDALSLANRIFL